MITIREFLPSDIKVANEIWNEVVRDGIAFPQEEELTEKTGSDFFQSQSFTGLAFNENGEAVGLYILHPNNVGRCGHICNASYAVKGNQRGQHIGEALVKHCLEKGAFDYGQNAEAHLLMHRASQDAIRITMEINNKYHYF